MKTLDVIIPFKTEIFITKIDSSVTTGVLEEIIKLHSSEQSTTVSNVGGWQSPSYTVNQNKFMTPVILEIKEYIREIYNIMDVDGSGEILNYYADSNKEDVVEPKAAEVKPNEKDPTSNVKTFNPTNSST